MSIPKKYFDKCDNNFCFDLDLRLQLVNKYKNIKEISINTFYGTERSSFHIIYAIRFFYKVTNTIVQNIINDKNFKDIADLN